MPSRKDEVSRRPGARRDPRVDPDSVPKMHAVKGGLVEEVAQPARRDPRVDPASVPAMKAVKAPPEEERSGERPSVADAGDPRLAEIEPLLARTAWREIAEKLGPADKAADLPPGLALIYAVARRESAGDEGASDATQLAIGSMAAMLGVSSTSGTALVMAKRLLRQNPAGWRKPAPARLSAGVIILGLAVGAAVGWFMSLGSIKLF